MRTKLLTTLVCFIGLTASAQKLYIKLGGGQSWSAAGATNVTGWPLSGTTTYHTTGDLASFEAKTSSLGVGKYATLGVGLNLGKHVGLELSGVMGVSMKKNTSTRSFPDNGYFVSERNNIYANRPLFIAPSLVMRTGNECNVYMRAGFLLPMSVKVIDEFDGSFTIGTGTGRYEGTQEFKTNFSLGFSGATGFFLPIMKHVDLWGEATLNTISLTMKERTFTRYTENGHDAMQSIPAKNRNIKYTKEGTSNDGYPTFSLPFSSFGFNVGIAYRL